MGSIKIVSARFGEESRDKTDFQALEIVKIQKRKEQICGFVTNNNLLAQKYRKVSEEKSYAEKEVENHSRTLLDQIIRLDSVQVVLKLAILFLLFINIMKKYNIRPNLTEPHPLIRVFMQQEIAPYGRIGRMAGIGDFFN